jgi:8-oxo-dGTP pyrophosphatase MutT (NUDIX family)
MYSWIQYHVLQELTRHETRRYSQLRPEDIEGNLFMYHIKGLIKDGLVEKNNRDYKLTIKGLQFAGTLSLVTGKTRLQPKILTAVVCRNEAGEYLFSHWHRQPNIGKISFPHGMVHFGQSIYAMAALELAEKAGLTADFTYLGDVYIRGRRSEETDRHMLVHVFEADNMQPGRRDAIRPEVSEPFWASLQAQKASDFVPGFYEIALLIEHTSPPFFKEITIEIPYEENS